MSSEVKRLLRARDTAFKSGDTSAYSVARANLKRGIRSAKHNYKLWIEEDFNSNSNPRRMWQGIQSITDYKRKNNTQHTPANNTVKLAEELNNLTTARFDKDNNQPPVSFKLLDHPQTLVLHTHKVQQALLSINTRKAAGPDGVQGLVLQACADQLAEVFTHILNLSLSLCMPEIHHQRAPSQKTYGNLSQ